MLVIVEIMGRVVYNNSVINLQFFCKPETALKIAVCSSVHTPPHYHQIKAKTGGTFSDFDISLGVALLS